MKIRSTGELNEFLNKELVWRKRELTNIKLLLAGTKRSHYMEALLRSNVCILYAHWEGFVKSAATAYLNYVARKGLRYRDLTPNFVALAVRSELRTAEDSNRMTIHTKVTEFLLSGLHERATLPWSDAVSARDNLNSEVLQEILCLLRLEYTPYETKKVMIDQKLLARRNSIAHGERLYLSVADYDEVHSEIMPLIEMFRTDVENAAHTNAFLRSV
jgi:hypothetical protein